MNAVRGHVRGGRVETDTPLPEGAEVVVLTDGGEEPFDIDEADTVELEARTAEADGGQVEPAGILLARLRGR